MKRKRKFSRNHTQPRMPKIFSGDPHVVKWLLEESERMAHVGNRFAEAKIPNPVAARACFKVAWAHAQSGAWLRKKLNGEFGPPRPEKRKRGRPRKVERAPEAYFPVKDTAP